MSPSSTKAIGLLAGAFATLWLTGCGGLSADAQAVADACSKVPGATAESCQCYAKELSSKLKPELMKLATYAQTDPGKLFDPAEIVNLRANVVMTVTNTSAAALKTRKVVG